MTSAIGVSLTTGELVEAALAHGLNVVEAAAPDAQQALAGTSGAVAVVLGGVLADLAGLGFGQKWARLERQVAAGLLEWADLTPTLHCLAPRYLFDEVRRARERLARPIDIYVLDRPEAHLGFLPRREFARRMTRAFEVLEQSCADGAIGRYGVHTRAARLPASHPLHVVLEELVGLAREVAGDPHHFRALRVPLSLSAPEAATARSQPGGATLVEAAAHHGLSVFGVFEPLSAVLDFDYRRALPGLASDEQRSLQFGRSVPGVTSILVPASDPFDIEEAAEVASLPPAPADDMRALLAAIGEP